MMTRALLTLVMMAPAVASATTMDVLAEGVLVGTGSFVDGVGSPTVTWDATAGVFVMFFESQVPFANCTEAWVIGSATSPDGYAWTPGNKVVGPVAGTAHPCGARRPAAMIDADGTRMLVYNVVDEVRDDQIAIMDIAAGQRSSRIVPELDGLIEPTLAKFEDEWVLLAVRSDPADQAVVTARSTDAVAWTLDATDAVPMASTPWALDGTASPTLVCNDASSYEWEVYYGGWTASETAWTWGISDDANKWYITPAIDIWTDDTAWRSWEALKVGTATVVFYEDLDAAGLPRIGIAATTSTWLPAEAKARHCFLPN